MIVNKIVLIVNLYKDQYQYDSKKKKKKNGRICQFNKYEIYYEIYYINSIACARYSRHCNGFSLYAHENKRCDIDDPVFGPRDKGPSHCNVNYISTNSIKVALFFFL